jgi:hypothetical protein
MSRKYPAKRKTFLNNNSNLKVGKENEVDKPNYCCPSREKKIVNWNSNGTVKHNKIASSSSGGD